MTVDKRPQLPKPTRLAVVVLNYRTPSFVMGCLQSLVGEIDAIQDSVVVVDNASGDGSADRIDRFICESGMSLWANVLRAPKNDGFSAGNNFGVQNIEADFYLLLNSDTIVLPGAISTLLEYADSHPTAALVCPRLEWPDGTAQRSCFRFHRPTDEFFFAAGTGILEPILGYSNPSLPVSDCPMKTEWASFAAILIRREVFERIGMMDDGYFMYYEDIAYCRRARDAGFETWYCPEAHVVHLRGGSSPVKSLSKERKRLPAYWYASRNRYYVDFYGRFGLWLANTLWYLGRSVSWIREVVGNKRPHTSERQWLDIWTNAWNPLRPFRNN